MFTSWNFSFAWNLLILLETPILVVMEMSWIFNVFPKENVQAENQNIFEAEKLLVHTVNAACTILAKFKTS